MSLKNIYYDIRKPQALGSLQKLKSQSNSKIKNIEAFLNKQRVYTLHKQSRKRFQRVKTISKGLHFNFQSDIVDFSNISKYNKNCKYVLTVIDTFSRYGFTRCLKNKSSRQVSEAFEDILKRNPDRICRVLQTDDDKAYHGKDFQRVLRKYGIRHYTTNSELKAAVVERFNKTIKTKLVKYMTANNTKHFMSILPTITDTYNKTKHRSINMAPKAVTLTNSEKVWDTQYVHPKFWRKGGVYKNNTFVRLSKMKKRFEKSYTPNWTEELFIITKVLNTIPVTYTIKDLENTPIRGKFYHYELTPFVPDKKQLFQVDKILRKSGNRVYVSFKGLDESHNSWVPKKYIKKK